MLDIMHIKPAMFIPTAYWPSTRMAGVADLARLADDKRLVIAAYVCAFIPWGFLYASDFISANWRTVRKTRLLAALHLLISIPPMSVVLFYSVVQDANGDYKEMMAAVLALVFSLYHVARTVFGLVQVRAFMKWCIETKGCMHDIGLKSDVDKSSDVALLVNNTVVDNELNDTEIIVKPKIFNYGSWNPINWWTTKAQTLCTLRWTGSFLCSYGKQWRSDANKDTLKDLFTGARQSLSTLLSVTFEGVQKNDSIAPFSLALAFRRKGGIKLAGMAYNSIIKNYVPDKTFKERIHQFNNLVSTYNACDDKDDNRNNLLVELVDSVVMAKHLGGDRLVEIRRSFMALTFPTDAMLQKAWQLLLSQCGELRPTTSESNQNPKNIPQFPWKRLMYPLWDRDTNLRVLQATAHKDIHVALKLGGNLKLVEEANDCHIFDHYTRLGATLCSQSHQSAALLSMRPTAVVLETVRSFFAENLVSTNQLSLAESKRVWDPLLPVDTFSLHLSDQLLNNLEKVLTDDVKTRIVWECQLALQRSISGEQVSTHQDFPSSTQLIMLFLLGYPCISVYPAIDQAWSESKGKETGSNVIIMGPSVAPKSIVVELHIEENANGRNAMLKLRGNPTNCNFEWHDWINAAMGFLNGYDVWNPPDRLDNICRCVEGYPGNLFRQARTISKTDVRNLGIMTFSPPEAEISELPGDLHIWNGWPIFDVRICQYEMKQWIRGAGLDNELANMSASTESRFDKEVEKAEKALSFIARPSPSRSGKACV